jgi:hypothetical protein
MPLNRSPVSSENNSYDYWIKNKQETKRTGRKDGIFGFVYIF